LKIFEKSLREITFPTFSRILRRGGRPGGSKVIKDNIGVKRVDTRFPKPRLNRVRSKCIFPSLDIGYYNLNVSNLTYEYLKIRSNTYPR
jgi:hypothetical protein